MRLGSKTSVKVSAGVVALSLAVAGVAVAKTAPVESVAVNAGPTVNEKLLIQDAASGAGDGVTTAPAAEQYAKVSETAANVQEVNTQVSGLEVVSQGPGYQGVQVSGPVASSQVRAVTPKVQKRREAQGARGNGTLAVTVRSVGENEDAVRSSGSQKVQQVQRQRAVSRSVESEGVGSSGVDNRQEEPRSVAVERRTVAPSRSTVRLTTDPVRVEDRLQELRKRERRDLIALKPATASAYSPAASQTNRSRELRVAREDITARSVPRISSKRYEMLYREAAREYGFAEDWYILAAVGKVESDHGRNLGPSTAGAMGPMQFLPSTWKAYGLDGNSDGVANTMDPEDAIPAAASYLEAGGAPEDWYAALYTYNRAGWYVKKVLTVAEAYRELAGDTTVGPYS